MITEQYTIPNIEPSSGALTEQGGNSIVSGGNLESLVFSDTSGYQLRPNGDAIFRNLTLTGGKLNYQKTSFTDSTNAGYYIGKEGIYFGSASDTKRLKFDIDTGAFDFIGTIAGRDTNAIAFGDQYGNLTKEVINAKLDTSTKEILGDFTFGASGAIKMNTDADNGLWISPTGLLGKKSGATTFAIDTSGNATFKGDITGSTGTFGSVTITSGSISWSTVGGTGKPADDATEGATLGTNVSGGSTDANNIDNSGYITQIDADSITTGKLTVGSSGIGIKVNSGGDIVFESESYSTFSEIKFTKKNYNNAGWDIYFTATGGGGYNEGDLVFSPQSSNLSKTVSIGSFPLTTIGDYTDLAVYGDCNISGTVSTGQIYPKSNSSYYLGTSSYLWSRVYSNYYYFGSKYLYEGSSRIITSSDFVASGSLHATGNVYTGGVSGSAGSLNGALLHLAAGTTNPASAGDIRNYASGATDQFRGIPGDGTWAGSFDMTAY